MVGEDIVKVYGADRVKKEMRSPRQIIPKAIPKTQEELDDIEHRRLIKENHPVNRNTMSFKTSEMIRMETRAKSIMKRQKEEQGFIYHMTTKNISFLQTSKDLAALGIKNNKFFLKLYDERLIDVNPHDKNLSDEMKFAVLNECLRNPWYYLRECCLIPFDGSTGGQPYLLNRANLASTFCFLNHIDHYLVIPRQKGKTQSTIAIITWTFLFGTASTEMMFINKQQKDADANLDRLKKQRDLLPDYMRMKELIDPESGKLIKGDNNVTSLVNPVTRNKIVTKPGARTVEAAEGIGRGATQTVQYYDEVEFTNHIKTIVEAAGPAYNTASKNAKRNNAAHCRVFTTTPGDLDTRAAQEGLQIIEDAAKWTERFYDWTQARIDEYMRMYSKNRIIYIEYNYKQLGDDEKWYTDACVNVGNNPIKIKREILLKRMHGSSQSPFDLEDLQIIEGMKKPILQEMFIHDVFRIDVYKELDRTKTYILGMDCATGIGVDNTTFTLIDPYDLRPVAEFASPWISGTQAARLVEEFVKTHVPRTIIAVESNSIGNVIIEILMESTVRHNVYYENPQDYTNDEQLDAKGMLVMEAARRRKRGVQTNSKSRPQMMQILEQLVREDKEAFVTENITSQLMTLIRKKNGRIDHSDGKHDDSLMSYLIGLYVYYHGKNLSKFGFVRGLPSETSRNQGLSYADVYDDLSDEVKEVFGQQAVAQRSQNDYSNSVYEENARIRRQMDAQLGVETMNGSVEDVNTQYDSYDFDAGFFDELND